MGLVFAADLSSLIDPMAARITSEADLEAALAALIASDPRLVPAYRTVGAVPLRLIEPGLEGLLRIVNSQQLSTASARALWLRVTAALAPFEAERLAGASDETLRAAGLSRQKARTFRAIGQAVTEGLDLRALAEADPDEARARLEAICGIGRWTADLYLMFCAGQADILPVGDLAVRRGAQLALARPEAFEPDELDGFGRVWSPHRSTVTRLFYAYYGHCRTAAGKGLTGAAERAMPL